MKILIDRRVYSILKNNAVIDFINHIPDFNKYCYIVSSCYIKAYDVRDLSIHKAVKTSDGIYYRIPYRNDKELYVICEEDTKVNRWYILYKNPKYTGFFRYVIVFGDMIERLYRESLIIGEI